MPALEVRGHDVERNLEPAEVVGKGVGQERVHDPIGIKLDVEAVLQQTTKIAYLCAPEATGDDAHGAQYADRVLAQLGAAHTVGPARADERADRGTGDDR